MLDEPPLLNAAGAFHVAAELARRGWSAGVTPSRDGELEVLAQRQSGDTVAITPVVAAADGRFRLTAADEDPGAGSHEWYVLVALQDELERPIFYPVPRRVVAAIVYLEHQEWLLNAGRLHERDEGQRREPSAQRTIRAEWVDGYRERWILLERPTSETEFLGSRVLLDLADELSLPASLPPLEPSTGWR